MIIKKEESKLKIFNLLLKPKKFFLILIPALLITLLLSTLLPTHIHVSVLQRLNSNLHPSKSDITGRLLDHDRPIDLIVRYLKAFSHSPEKIKLNIKYSDYQKLNYRVYLARQRGEINAEDKKTIVNATIDFKQKSYKAKVRLRGTYLDHIQGNKWSFRIKLKGTKSIWGMNKFSVHDPKTRRDLFEWFYHKAHKYVGLVTLKYKFAEILLNGKSLGIYAVEEFFDKRLVESNSRREGILLRDNFKPFQENKISKSPILKNMTFLAKSLHKDFKSKHIPASDYYDLDKTAKHMAITQICNAPHSHVWFNYIVYFNPITAKAVPIGYDANPSDGLKVHGLTIEKRSRYYYRNYKSTKVLYHDFEFFKLYLKYLVKFSAPEFFNEFFKENREEMGTVIKYMVQEYPIDLFGFDWIKDNQKYVRTYFSKYISDFDKPIKDETVLNIMKDHNISPNTILSKKAKDFLLIRKPKLTEYSFLKVNKKTIRIPSGSYKITKDLIIPAGYIFEIEPGTSLELKNSASIISYSPLRFIGSKNRRITIFSNPKSRSGLFVAYTDKKSVLNHVDVRDLSPINTNALNITGATTFYEADVDIRNSRFIRNHKSDDNLNIVRSKFYIDNIKLIASEADALDIDFGVGKIVNSSFIDSGNDGLDCSGSDIKGENLSFSGSGDKAISIGEGTKSSFNNIKITSSNHGLAGKDNSIVNASNISINNTNYGVSLYQKKNEYGPSIVKLKNLILKNIHKKDYLIEKGSKLYVNENLISAKEKNLRKILY